ncbi:MAG: OmpH family outer membrane protein [Verrucomicrobia bacterium]|nr:OmpH family outer membrane protein [Verrucomicrobiota bacterium]
MKKIFLFLSVLLLLTSAAQAQSRVAVIDLRKVFDNYYKTQLADANLKDEAGDLENQRKEMMEEMRKGEDQWKKLLDNANDQAISATERDKSKQSAEKKLLELRQQEETLKQFERSARAKLGEKHRRKRDVILEEIRTLINTRAKAQGFSLVIDTASESINSTPIVLYTSGENDITDMVLKELNSSASPSILKSLEERKDDRK